MNARSDAYDCSDESNSFRACSRFVTGGADGARVASVEASDMMEFRPIVAVGEPGGDSSSGGTGRGFSPDSENVSHGGISDPGVGGMMGVFNANCSSAAVREATLFLRFTPGLEVFIRSVVIVSRREYMSKRVVNEETLFGEGRNGERGGGGGGGIEGGDVREGEDIEGDSSFGLMGGVMGF